MIQSLNSHLVIADNLTSSVDQWNMDECIKEVEVLLNYKFKNTKLVEDAFTHPSYKAAESYERLEHLGDIAIGLIVSSYLFCAYPEAEPGEMTLIRSVNVSTEKLARVAVKHGLYKYLRHNVYTLHHLIREFVAAVEKEEDGSELYGGVVKAPKVLADIVESIAAAIYVDCGMNVEKLWMSFRSLMEPFITPDLLQKQPQPVTSLYELCGKEGKGIIVKQKRKQGKSVTCVFVDGILVSSASSKQKEHAKLKAAKIALDKLLQKPNTTSDTNIINTPIVDNNHGDEKRLKVKPVQSDKLECPKEKLHELCNKRKWLIPSYRVVKQSGPPHNRRFVCSVQIPTVKGIIVLHGEEKSRIKNAESSAASEMLKALQSTNYI